MRILPLENDPDNPDLWTTLDGCSYHKWPEDHEGHWFAMCISAPWKPFAVWCWYAGDWRWLGLESWEIV